MRTFRTLLSILFLLVAVYPGHAQQPASNDMVPELQIPSGDINTLLDLYEKISGKVMIRDANIVAVPNIRLVVNQPIPKAEALRLLESVLMLNGYSLVPSEDNSVKIINATSGKNPRSEGVPIYANLADLPKGDQVVTYFMQFQNIGAQEAAPIFQNQIPPHPWGIFVPVPHAQALIITENASTIRQMAKVQRLKSVKLAGGQISANSRITASICGSVIAGCSIRISIGR